MAQQPSTRASRTRPRWSAIATMLAITTVAVSLTASCSTSSGPPTADTSTSSRTTTPHSKPVDPGAAAELARSFIEPYGTFSPANIPEPGQVWIRSWRSMATDPVVDRATADFDRLWSWTWEQLVQCHDVQVTGDLNIEATGLGTVIVRLPARRYVLGLTARADAGRWQDLRFEVTVGPRNPTLRNDNRLAVYLVTMTAVEQV